MIKLGFGVSGVEFVTDGLEEVGGGRWVGGARGGGAGQHRGSQGGGAWSHVKEDQRGVAMVTGKKKRVTRCYTRPKVLHKSTLLEHFLKLSFAVAPTLYHHLHLLPLEQWCIMISLDHLATHRCCCTCAELPC
jgi:hypothetical protein